MRKVQRLGTRRAFLRMLGTGTIGTGILLSGHHRTSWSVGSSGGDFPKPSQAQQVWQDAEVGIIFHFDLPIAAGEFAPNNAVRHTLDPNLYNPKKLDTDQWLEAAKAAGAGYAVFTATHFSGFMQWQSDLYPYGLKQTHWRSGKGDVVKDFVESCHKYGIQPALYFSTHRNVYWEVWGHWVDWGKGKGTPEQAAFNRICEGMTEELCSRYGKLFQIWYDAGVKTPAEGGPDVLPIFERYQPDSVFYHSLQRADHRWIGNEAGYAGYPCWATIPGPQAQAQGHLKGSEAAKYLLSGDPRGQYWCPAMVDVPLRGSNKIHSWCWRPNEEKGIDPVEKLVKMYHQSVGRNCNLVIGAVIDPDGQVPEPDVARLKEFGDVVRKRFGNPLTETQGYGNEVVLSIPPGKKFGHLVLMEDISQGERVRKYEVLIKTADDTWDVLCTGECIGHKRIEEFAPAETTELKLRITESIAPVRIKKLAVYSA